LIGDGLSAKSHDIEHLFFYRKTAGFDLDAKAYFASASRPNGPIALARMAVRLIREIKRFKPDAVLCFQHYGNIIGSIATRITSSATVIANQLSAPSVVPDYARSLDWFLGTSGAYDAIVVNSHATQLLYDRHPPRYRKRLVRVEHGFEPKHSGIGTEAARRRLGLPSGSPIIGCAARLNRTKRLDLAVALLPSLPRVHLALAGQGPEEEALRQLVADLDVGERVHFLGELPTTDIPDFLAALDVFVFPSEAETFGLAAIEAAQSGVPCVVNDLPVLHEVLTFEGLDCALFAKCMDLGNFSEQVQKALNRGPVVMEMTARARRLGERFPVTDMIDSYDALLRSFEKPAR
jgi:glycosyltransferase involved in cell wall biosynthesis